MKGTVKQAFPFAFDGSNFMHLKVGDDFPPAGYSVQDNTFEGLRTAGFIEAAQVRKDSTGDEELNRRIIDALDKRLSAASDEELKAIVARRGTPFSGNMVHAVLVTEAKTQMLAEFEGSIEPVTGIDPNSGVTEQPLAAPGAPTPPSAAAAVDQQKAQQEAAGEQEQGQNDKGDEQNQGGGKPAAGDGKPAGATNQFGEPVPTDAKSGWKSEAELKAMNKAELEAYAEEKKVDLSNARTKDDYISALKPKD
jgi:hypothetical protein